MFRGKLEDIAKKETENKAQKERRRVSVEFFVVRGTLEGFFILLRESGLDCELGELE